MLLKNVYVSQLYIGTNLARNLEAIWVGTVNDWTINYFKDINRFSSSYYYEVDKKNVYGYERGYVALNGIAAASNFYEHGTNKGIDLLVQKSEDEFYATYWAIDSMANFNYSTKADADTVQGIQKRKKKWDDVKINLDISERNECLLSDYEAREKCIPK